MASELMSRRDLDFLLYEWLDAESLTDRARFSDHGRDTFDAGLDLAEQVATEDFAPPHRMHGLTARSARVTRRI